MSRYGDGRLAIIVRGDNGLMHLRTQQVASGTLWNPWSVLGDSVARF